MFLLISFWSCLCSWIVSPTFTPMASLMLFSSAHLVHLFIPFPCCGALPVLNPSHTQSPPHIISVHLNHGAEPKFNLVLNSSLKSSFQEAHVPASTPREALSISGYTGPFDERQDNNNRLTYVRADLEPNYLPLPKMPGGRCRRLETKKKKAARALRQPITSGRLLPVSLQYEGHTIAILNVQRTP